jgi:DNA-binding CsgD family transcriptional regulator
MQCSDNDIERRNRLIEEVYPALRRMAGRHRQKAGLPWQNRDDLTHDLVVKLCEVYERYHHLDDESIKRLFVRTASNCRIEHTRRSISQSLYFVGGDTIECVASNDQGLARVDAVDEVVVLAKRAGWTRKELQVVLLLASGRSERDAASLAQISQTTLRRLKASADAKRHMAQKHTQNRYTVSTDGETCQ